MIIETGHFALILAFGIALFQALIPLYGAAAGQPRLMQLARPAAVLQFVLVGWAFGVLTWAFATSDFSVHLVAENSHAAKPFIYKIAGVWGNHEGSMLLWILILTGFGGLLALRSEALPQTLLARTLAIQSILSVLFISFSLFTSNPFARLWPVPYAGGGLNPILQDPALALHPPLLYLGYVGFSVGFSMSVAALLEADFKRGWAGWVRPYILAAWVFLTLGIALGSFWAYYELGWGGFWFWDPVENASLLPWLAGTALLHSALVAEHRNSMRKWTLLLAVLTFGLSVAGTFLVRSGVLTSVHAFANDPARGVFILAILAVTVGGALWVFATRADKVLPAGPDGFDLASRETALLVNNVFLASATATILIGTIYPLIIDGLGLGKISVGAPYFNLVFTPLMAPLVILIPFGPLLVWQKGQGARAWRLLKPAAALTGVFSFVLFVTGVETGWMLLGLAGAAWLVFGALTDLKTKARLGAGGVGQNLMRLRRLPGQAWGVVLAHAGVGVLLFGIVATTAWQKEAITTLKAGQGLTLGGYEVTLKAVNRVPGPNYQAEQGLFEIARQGQAAASLRPERRYYPVERSQTTEAAILKQLDGNLYIALGERLEGVEAPDYVVRVWLHPFVNFIWVGGLLMALGGGVSLVGRVRRKALSGQPVQGDR
ncbi:MAG: heme lyase CcmF/NrfE family subunit [Parvibaculales bacterium]